MIPCNVLVTNAGTATAVSIIKSLIGKVNGIYAVDISEFCYANKTLGEHFFKVPPLAEEENYKKALLDICIKNKIKYIIPCSSDDELLFFSTNMNEFKENSITPIISNTDSINICDDKYKTVKHIDELGLKTPITFLPDNIPEDIKFPLIIKSRNGNGSQYYQKINDSEELQFFQNQVPNSMIQEFVSGSEYTLDTLSDLTGKVIVCLCRERVTVKSGISVKANIIDKPDYIEKTKKVVESMKIVGPCNTQIIDDKFIEINPRFSGGLGLSIASGINLPLLCIKIFEGLPISEKELIFNKDIKVCRVWEEVILND
jgi:carbamoyl-phosphate synthase large subunit